MSGQLVGEVMAASPQLRAGGLSKNGFLALIAIAEKASNGDRQASVRWDHLRDGLYGVSKKTAQRAVKELEQVGLIRVVSAGWANQHGSSRAPIYGIGTPVSLSTNRIGTPVSTSNAVDEDKSEVDEDKSELDEDTRAPQTSDDSSLDGSSDGSIGGDARASERTDHTESPPGWATPPPKCHKHPNGYEHDEGCRRCQRLREWDENADERRRQNYDAAWKEFKQLESQARTGMYGSWRPQRPPRFAGEFDPNVPWEQPNPPPEVAPAVNGFERW